MGILIQTMFFFLLVAQICLAQWVQVGLDDYSINDIAVQNSIIFAVTSDSGKVYRSIDSGTNWTMIVDSNAADIAISPTGKVFMVWDSLRIYDPYLFSKGGLLSSLDNGNTWIWSDIMEQLVDSIPMGGWQNHITVSPTGTVFCNVNIGFPRHDVIARSTDDGMVWTTPGMSVYGGQLLDFREQFVITIGMVAHIGARAVATNYSSDDGNTWTYILCPPLLDFTALGFFTNGNILEAGTLFFGDPPEIHISTDMGGSWTKKYTFPIQIPVGLSCLLGSEERMLIGTEGLGVFLFTDECDSLGSRNEGLTNLNVQALTLDNNGYVYAGTGNGVWRRPLSEIVTLVEDEITQPTEFLLSQNYPNPFNSSSVIRYAVPKSLNVVIKVFDILGNEIETIVNEEKPAGTYELTWYAENLPSGIYFYQLKAGEYAAVKKMILLR